MTDKIIEVPGLDVLEVLKLMDAEDDRGDIKEGMLASRFLELHGVYTATFDNEKDSETAFRILSAYILYNEFKPESSETLE